MAISQRLHGIRLGLAAVMALVCGLAASSAMAKCGTPTLTVIGSTTLTAYNPFVTGLPTSVTYKATVTPGNSCTLYFVLWVPAGSTSSMSLASPPSTLTYTVTANGSPLAVSTYNTLPSSGQYLSLGTITTSVSVTVVYTVPKGQVVAAGTYSETVYPKFLTSLIQVRGTTTIAETLSDTVSSVCTLAPPTTAAIDFSTKVSTGIANPATVPNDTIGAQCTAPSGITLSGNSLQRTPVGTAPVGFNNYINWTATATIGSATATLTTTGLTATPTVTSTNKNTTTVGAFSGPITISNLHLLAGNMLLPGAYNSSLTIQIDPSL